MKFIASALYRIAMCVALFGILQGQDSIKIMPLGDSITELNWQGGYRSYLYKLLSDSGFVFDFVGRRTVNHNDASLGFSFPQPYWDHEGYTGRAIYPTWLDHIDTALNANPPDIILLMLGTNDVANGTRTTLQIRNFMSALLDSIWIFDPNIKVVLSNICRVFTDTISGGRLMTPDKLDSIVKINSMLPDLVEEKKQAGRFILMVDNFSALTDSTDFDGDGVHPSVNGYKKMRYVWYPAVVAALKSITKLGFNVEPSNVVSGEAINPAVAVRVEDILGSTVTSDNSTAITLSLKTNPGNGTLTGGGTVTVTNGIAVFPNLSINKAGVGYVLEAKSPTVVKSGVSSPFNVVHGAAAKLLFHQGPTNVVSGAVINPNVTVRVEDANENIVTSDNTTTVTLTLEQNPGGGMLTGNGPVTVQNGTATFSALSIDKAGIGYVLKATSNPALLFALSDTFNVAAGAAAKLAFEEQPTNTERGDTINPIVVRVEDANSNVVSSDNTTIVTLTIETNPAGGVLTGTSSVIAVNGYATFNNLSIDKAGTGYTLKATSNPALAVAVSSPFNILPTTGVVNTTPLPTEYALRQNYPNPFNPVTTIRYDVPKESFVRIAVYDLLGRVAATLVNEVHTAGRYVVSFNAGAFSSGVYLYSMRAGEFYDTRRMILTK